MRHPLFLLSMVGVIVMTLVSNYTPFVQIFTGSDIVSTESAVVGPNNQLAGTAAIHANGLQNGKATQPQTQFAVKRTLSATDGWAFYETFDGDPSAPSQALLPRSFDYVVTHRTHPAEHLKTFNSFLADHDMSCAGPNPALSPLPQHAVTTSHLSNGKNPDESFYICKNHMMSSMGEVEGYSVSAFWPKQEFDFSNGGQLEFDVNLNDNHPRSWWEVVIMPREQLRVGAAHEWLPIDETYPEDRIIFDFIDNKRTIQVGTGAIEPEGIIAGSSDWTNWAGLHPNDPANSDRRIRRTMRMKLESERIIWSIQRANGTFDDYTVNVPGGLPFTRGLVVFKTHAYTPIKEGNRNVYTFHWDNIRFSGPVVGLYEDYEAEGMAYLQANGDRQIGEKTTLTIELPEIESTPILFGQVHNAMNGQVLLSINGGPQMVVHPFDYGGSDCHASGWESFRLPLDPAWVHEGENSFTWEIGPRPSCVVDWIWDGFSVKNLEVQLDMPFDHFVYFPIIDH